MADITPTTGLIDGMRHQTLGWFGILGEFIDNAFDAGANRVEINFTNDQLEIVDNGEGCRDLLLMLRPGGRESKATTTLGRYGIGAKDAAISAAQAVKIRSVHRGVQRFVHCDWRKVEKSGRWEIADPTDTPTDEPSGTKIILQPLRSDRLKRQQDLIEKLSFYYTPAIRQGRQIVFKASAKARPAPVPEYRFPELEHLVTAQLNVGGKEAMVTIGLIPEGKVVRESGLVLSYGYRVIRKGERIGLGDQPTPGLFGWVELGSGWELTKNKDNISSNIEALGVAIYEACREVIDRASRRSQAIQFRNVAKEVNDLLKSFVGDYDKRKAKRLPAREKEGTILPVSTGKRHSRARLTQPGNTFEAPLGESCGLQVSFENIGADGAACRYSGGCIYLNVDIPAINTDRHDPKALARHAIYAAAAHFALNDGMFSIMRDCENDFDRMAKIAGHLLTKMSEQSVSMAEAG